MCLSLFPYTPLFRSIGLTDSLYGLLLIYLGGQIPFNAWLVKGYFDTIPKELDEAAKIDGAGHLRVFWTIMLPLAKPILAVVVLFIFMSSFMGFLFMYNVLCSSLHLYIVLM